MVLIDKFVPIFVEIQIRLKHWMPLIDQQLGPALESLLARI
jgi:hypothetical protein